MVLQNGIERINVNPARQPLIVSFSQDRHLSINTLQPIKTTHPNSLSSCKSAISLFAPSPVPPNSPPIPSISSATQLSLDLHPPHPQIDEAIRSINKSQRLGHLMLSAVQNTNRRPSQDNRPPSAPNPSNQEQNARGGEMPQMKSKEPASRQGAENRRGGGARAGDHDSK